MLTGATGREASKQRPAARARGSAARVSPFTLRYSYAVSAAAILSLSVAMHIAGVRGTRIPSTIPFVVAVLVTAYVWGRGPAVVAALTAGVAFNYYFVPPPNAFTIPTWPEVVFFIGLLAIALGMGTATDLGRAARREAARLAESERLQKTLLSSISHDLRTPLTAIMGSLTTLMAEEGPVGRLDAATRRELLSIAYDQTRTLNRLVEQLLEMTRLEAGVVTLQREPGTLQDLLRLVLSPMGAGVAGRVRMRLAPEIPPVQMDIVLLSHAVRNVLDNAARYSPSGSPIDVDASAQPGEIVLSVADRGAGIPAADLVRVFEKFYQLPSAAAAGDGGSRTGLGLAIARGIVEAHGGRIWAEPREGGGTIIRLMLPRS